MASPFFVPQDNTMPTECKSILTEIEPGICVLRYLGAEGGLLTGCSSCVKKECRFINEQSDLLAGKILVIDMREVKQANSIFWHRLFLVIKKGYKAVLFGVPSMTAQTFMILGGNKIVDLVATEEEALVCARKYRLL